MAFATKMDESSDLISDLASGIFELSQTELEKTSRDICLVTQDVLEKTSRNMSQATQDEIEQIARQVHLLFHYDVLGSEPHAKRPCLTVPTTFGDYIATKVDEEVGENESININSHVEGLFSGTEIENTSLSHDEFLCVQKEYSLLVEQLSSMGDGRANQSPPDEHFKEQESCLFEHARKRDDLYYEELAKIHKSTKSQPEINEDEDLDLSEYPENLAGNEQAIGGHEIQEDKLVYEGCPLTVSVSMLLIMTLAMRHGLTGEALQDILTLISLHCISPNYCVESLRKFKQFFGDIKNPLVFHNYCPHCFLHLSDKRSETCPNLVLRVSLERGRKTPWLTLVS